MSCYFRHLRDLFAEAGVAVTPGNKQALDRALHAAVGVPYKHCMGMDGCWSQVKAAAADPAKRRTLVQALKKAR